MIFAVNNQKMIRPLVGQLAQVSGTIKVKSGVMNLQGAKAIEATAIPPGAPERRLLDSGRRNDADPKTWEKIRHELAMMPYTSEFDFISFTLSRSEVILTGRTVRQTNRDYAYNVVKNIRGSGQQYRYPALGQYGHADPRRSQGLTAASIIPVLLG
jgi:hypothetical protein